MGSKFRIIEEMKKRAASFMAKKSREWEQSKQRAGGGLESWTAEGAIEEWNDWYRILPKSVQKAVDRHDLDVTKKYALLSDPLRASYFRLAKVTVCKDEDDEDADLHLHLTLIAFTSYDEMVGAAVEVDPDRLTDYPYESEAEIPRQRIDDEMEFVKQVAHIEDRLMSGKQVSSYSLAGLMGTGEAEVEIEEEPDDEDDEDDEEMVH